jgi:hypothetical protein
MSRSSLTYHARQWSAKVTIIVIAIFATCAAGATFATPVAAEVGVPAGTVQQDGADAQFLDYAPASAAPGVVCLVDSGVDSNPDTSPTLVGSFALSSGTDTQDELSRVNPPLPGGHPDGHGTYMDMLMAAPRNGWGMVGIAPSSVRVLNVKALGAGHSTFPFSEYTSAIQYCEQQSSTFAITVINLSLGSGTQPSSSDLSNLQNQVDAARQHGVSVVAAAGNNDEAVEYPAAATGVFAVGAADANPANLGVFCSFSNRGPPLSILAPGCGSQSEPGGGGGLDIAFSDTGEPAWAQGTSEASAIVSSVMASMRAYGPTLTAAQVEGCLISSEVNGGNLDVAGAFRACGLGQIVAEGTAAYNAANPPPAQAQSLPPSSTSVANVPSHGKSAATPAPRILRVHFVKPKLTVTVASIPTGFRLRIEIQIKDRHGRFTTITGATSNSRTVVLRALRWDRVRAFFLTTSGHSAITYRSRPVAPVRHKIVLGLSPLGAVTGSIWP